MADTTQSNSGFTLPAPTSPGQQQKQATTTTTQAPLPTINIGAPPFGGNAMSSRDLLIGGAVLLVLVVAFVFAKNAYATSLVGKKIQPRSANAAGWWLFIFLTLISMGVILAVVSNSVLMTPFIIGPLVLGAIVALILTILSSRR